jgi:two-component system, NarL family, nitrate/nitrite response regulator NarL
MVMPLRVFLVEDDAVTRSRLIDVFAGADGLTLIEAVANGEDAIQALDRLPPFECALVDLGLPGVHGLEVLRNLRLRRPDVASLVLTVLDDPETVLASVRAGARGYLLKHVGTPELLNAIRDATEGGAPMTPRIARIVLDAWRDHPRAPTRANVQLFEPLTARERQVLKLLATGETYSAVADALNIGLGTVQGYVKVIYGKLQVSSKAEATLLATRLGIVDR